MVLLVIAKAVGAQTPSAFSTSKPWAYWWWPGSAVTETGITHNLEAFSKAGFGGLHIIPIYGAKGYEAKFQPYLSDGWQQKFSFVLKEAKRLHLGIDMTLGTGWPLGGPQIRKQDAAKSYKIEEISIAAGQKWLVPKDVIAASVFINKVFAEELVTAKKSSFQAGAEGAQVYVFFENLTNQQVKRAAPGGEGLVMDHFSLSAFEHYRESFVPFLKKSHAPLRALYNDSYEVYGANYTPDLFTTFQQLNGYDLREHLDVLSKSKAESELENAIWADYHRTLARSC